MRRVLTAIILMLCVVASFAQPRRVQNRPYLDMRRLHYGFLFGFQMQDLEVVNNGYTDPETGEQWYADINNYNPGFNVGVLAELKINTHLSVRLSPTLYFGQKHMWMHEQTTGADTTQNIRSTIISMPVDLKISAPRYNNFRPYFIVGAGPAIDLTTKKHNAFLLKSMDGYLEIGMGCDVYLRYFKLIPEIKFCFGLANILKKNRTDLIDASLMKYTNAVDKAHSKMIVFSLYFE